MMAAGVRRDETGLPMNAWHSLSLEGRVRSSCVVVVCVGKGILKRVPLGFNAKSQAFVERRTRPSASQPLSFVLPLYSRLDERLSELNLLPYEYVKSTSVNAVSRLTRARCDES